MVPPETDLSTLLKISWALSRRGMSTEMGGLLSFESHETMREKHMEALNSEPPAGYEKPSLEQVYNADGFLLKEAARRLGDRGLRAVGNKLPLYDLVEPILQPPQFNLFLQPLLTTAMVNAMAPGGVKSRGRFEEGVHRIQYGWQKEKIRCKS